jgi:hypothetical protein
MASENEPLRILLIKRKEDALVQVEKHLVRRGFYVVSVVPLKVAVLKAIEIKAEFVFVPLDHPNPAAKQLPQVIQQLLNCHVIPYIETQAASSILEIRRQGLKYNLLPPIVAPKIDRMINRILLDKKTGLGAGQRHTDKQFEESFSNSPSDITKVHAPKQAVNETNQKVDLGKNSGLFYQFVRHSAAGKIDLRREDPETRKERSTDFFISHLTKLNQTDLPDTWRKNLEETAESYRARLQNIIVKQSEGSLDILNDQFLEKIEVKAMENCLHRLQTSVLNIDQDSEYDNVAYEYSKDDLRFVIEDLRSMNFEVPHDFLRKPEESAEDHLERINQSLISYRLKTGLLKEYNHLQSQTEVGSNIGLLNPSVNQVLDEATYNALLSLNEKSQIKETYHLVREVNRMTCLVVNKAEHRGYVVITTAKNQLENPNFQKSVFQEFQKSLINQGIDLSQSDVHQIEMQSIPFIDWAIKKANFVKQSSFEGEEVGLAFFPVNDFFPHFDRSPNLDLWQIKVQELQTPIKINFNLYLNLPLNQKLLLYIPRGTQEIENRLARLGERGIEVLYVKEEEMPEVRKYQAENFFEKEISDYQSELTRMGVSVVGE